jgi:methionyl-tRNA formyltransferase
MRYIFAGNRRFVLEAMLDNNLDLAEVIAASGTHLHRDIENGVIPGIRNYVIVSKKTELLDRLSKLEFDVLVSNGCPFILPIQDLPSAHYVNIHPSCLPDLRGVDPVIGSILFARDAGATCHVMDEGIDTGPVISQVRIPYTEDLDVCTLYQLSFIAEKQVFNKALELDFKAQFTQSESADVLYYNRRPEDWQISFHESNDELLRKIKAFNNRSQGCRFMVEGRSIKVFGAVRIKNPFLIEVAAKYPQGTVILSYENSIVFRKNGEVLRLLNVIPEDGNPLTVGTRLYAD